MVGSVCTPHLPLQRAHNADFGWPGDFRERFDVIQQCDIDISTCTRGESVLVEVTTAPLEQRAVEQLQPAVTNERGKGVGWEVHGGTGSAWMREEPADSLELCSEVLLWSSDLLRLPLATSNVREAAAASAK